MLTVWSETPWKVKSTHFIMTFFFSVLFHHQRKKLTTASLFAFLPWRKESQDMIDFALMQNQYFLQMPLPSLCWQTPSELQKLPSQHLLASWCLMEWICFVNYKRERVLSKWPFPFLIQGRQEIVPLEVNISSSPSYCNYCNCQGLLEGF